jgi:uncharacterized protein (DUF2141 family)
MVMLRLLTLRPTSQFRQVSFPGLLVVLLLGLGAGGASPSGPNSNGPVAPVSTPGGSIWFLVRTENDLGWVRCALYNDSKTWLDVAYQEAKGRAEKGQAWCKFANVPPGEYAISAFHDENENDEFDSNFFGLPAEGYCASNDARSALGPPRFDAAKFRFQGGLAVHLATVVY